MVKTYSPNYYKHSTRLTEVKTDSSNFYKPPTCLKKDKYTLYESQNRLSQLLLAFYMLFGGEQGLQNSTRLIRGEGLVKIDCQNLHKPPTYFAVVKTYSPNIHEPLSRFLVVKRDSTNFYKSPTRFAAVKSDC